MKNIFLIDSPSLKLDKIKDIYFPNLYKPSLENLPASIRPSAVKVRNILAPRGSYR